MQVFCIVQYTILTESTQATNRCQKFLWRYIYGSFHPQCTYAGISQIFDSETPLYALMLVNKTTDVRFWAELSTSSFYLYAYFTDNHLFENVSSSVSSAL